MGVDRLRKETGIQVNWRCFPLHPETPEEGQSLEQLFAGQVDIAGMRRRLQDVAAQLDLPFGHRTHTFNSRKAQELGKWAASIGHGASFERAVYAAYFVDGVNIGNTEELVGVAASAGLDADSARQVIETRSFAPAVDADWQEAMAAGITAVPTHSFRQRLLVGYRPYEDLHQFLQGH